jgi:hypothetical protein
MAHSTVANTSGRSVAFGPLGSIVSIPTGYTIETVVSLGQGINKAVEAWGDLLLAQYGKNRYSYKEDYLLQTLGYSTGRMHGFGLAMPL